MPLRYKKPSVPNDVFQIFDIKSSQHFSPVGLLFHVLYADPQHAQLPSQMILSTEAELLQCGIWQCLRFLRAALQNKLKSRLYSCNIQVVLIGAVINLINKLMMATKARGEGTRLCWVLRMSRESILAFLLSNWR